MNKDKSNISNIESFLYGLLNKKVSENTFVTTLPVTVKSNWKDMCLIDCGNSIMDMNAFGQGVVLVWLYVRPKASGAKDVAQMSALESKLNEVIGSASDSTYYIRRRNTFSDYDSERQWHCNVVELEITIL